MSKRVQFVLLTICCFFSLLLAACGTDEPIGSAVGTPSRTEINSDTNENEDTLLICVEENFADYAEDLIKILEINNSIHGLKILEIPKNISSRESVITNLRTELMAGEGPDVFIANCPDPAWAEDSPTLFDRTESIMKMGYFLPLDELIDDAEYMNIDNINHKILTAGQLNGAQVVLPLVYTYPVLAFNADDVSAENLPENWSEITTSPQLPIKEWAAASLFTNFYNLFGEVVNSAENSLAFTEDELLSTVENAVDFSSEFGLSEDSVQTLGDYFLNENLLQALADGDEHTLVPLSNSGGGLTTNITMYAAVNANTARPEDAFRVLDLLLSDEIMTCRGFNLNDKTYGNLVNFSAIANGVRVNDAWLDKICADLAESDRATLDNLNEKITAVRFLSSFDKELNLIYSQCRNAAPEQISATVSAAYKTLETKLAES